MSRKGVIFFYNNAEYNLSCIRCHGADVGVLRTRGYSRKSHKPCITDICYSYRDFIGWKEKGSNCGICRAYGFLRNNLSGFPERFYTCKLYNCRKLLRSNGKYYETCIYWESVTAYRCGNIFSSDGCSSSGCYSHCLLADAYAGKRNS